MPELENVWINGDQVTGLLTVARTVWGEARGEPPLGRQAVVNVIFNRARLGAETARHRWWGATPAEVCLVPYQFSAWNADNPNLAAMLAVNELDGLFASCLETAFRAFGDELADVTWGATHFMTRARRAEGWPASWGDPIEPCFEIGNHLFYNAIDS